MVDIVKSRKDAIYITCPVCRGLLGVAIAGSRKGAYNCWTSGCDSQEIKDRFFWLYGQTVNQFIETITQPIPQDIAHKRVLQPVSDADVMTLRRYISVRFTEPRYFQVHPRLPFAIDPFLELDQQIRWTDAWKQTFLVNRNPAWHYYGITEEGQRLWIRRIYGFVEDRQVKLLHPFVQQGNSLEIKFSILPEELYGLQWRNTVDHWQSFPPKYNTLFMAEGEKVCEWVAMHWKLLCTSFVGAWSSHILKNPRYALTAFAKLRMLGVQYIHFLYDLDLTGLKKLFLLKKLAEYVGITPIIPHPLAFYGGLDTVPDTFQEQKSLILELFESRGKSWDIADNAIYPYPLYRRYSQLPYTNEMLNFLWGVLQ